MVLLTGAIHLSSLPPAVMLGVDIAGIALVILMMAVGGDFNLTTAGTVGISATANEISQSIHENSAAPGAPLPLSPEEALNQMRERYGLTPRETDVVRELVLTEDKQAVISERLSIQVKTLQDYVTRLYRKTGATTRAGLTDLYHETRHRI